MSGLLDGPLRGVLVTLYGSGRSAQSPPPPAATAPPTTTHTDTHMALQYPPYEQQTPPSETGCMVNATKSKVNTWVSGLAAQLQICLAKEGGGKQRRCEGKRVSSQRRTELLAKVIIPIEHYYSLALLTKL